MSGLMEIQPFIQAYVEAISSMLDVDVTIVDSALIRVGGTGGYSRKIGQKIAESSFFKTVLECGSTGTIRDTGSCSECIMCEGRDRCMELASIAYPIFKKGTAVGVMALTAFDERARESLLCSQKKLEEFLKYMSVLLESKLIAEERNSRLESQLSEAIALERGNGGQIIGESPAMAEAIRLACRVAAGGSSVMLRGESGTGKDVLAKLIHARSSRGNRLMVGVNCAAIPENLVESELFGYAPGAFTGAKKEGHMGKFELANHSTIFLDEIGDMPFSAQTKLLRALQEGCIERIGSDRSTPVDVRVICATNRNLEEMVSAGEFRQDLYYRLNVIPVFIPPLRERREDIPLFTEYFIEMYNKRLKNNVVGVSPEAAEAFMSYDWPGNVRELKNMIEYLENIVADREITLGDLPAHIAAAAAVGGEGGTLKEIMRMHEKKILLGFLKNADTAEKKAALAKRLGFSRATLYRKITELGLE